MNIIQRMKAPTPKFFRLLRTVGLGMAAASGAMLATPGTLPSAVLTAASYLGVAGGVVTAVSQTAVKKEEEGETETGDDDD
jgi:hypothetical protein